MTRLPICQTLRCLLRLAALAAVVTGATAASAWSSKLTVLSDDVHSRAIERVFAKLTDEQRERLSKAQAVADANQATGQSDEHAMTGSETGDDVTDEMRVAYVKRSEALLRRWIGEAKGLAAVGKMNEAMLPLGRAVHLLQDATSEPHRPFQGWSDKFSWWTMAKHVSVELTYPDDPAELECATRWAYEIFTGKKPMPARFFRSDNQFDLVACKGV